MTVSPPTKGDSPLAMMTHGRPAGLIEIYGRPFAAFSAASK